MRLAVPILLTFLSAGCAVLARKQPPRLPASHAVTLGQLVVYSDQPLPQHHRLLEEVAQMRTELLGQLGLPTSDEPIYVYLFGSPKRFQEFVGANHADFHSRRALFVQGDTSLTVYAQWGDHLAEDLRHEVSHGYLHSVVPNIPLWLDEGLAECSEVPRARNGMNTSHYALLTKKVREGWRPDLARLETLSSAAEMTQLEYAESWAWAHFLLKTTPQRRWLLAAYLREIQHSGQTSPLAARVQETTRPMPCEEMLLGYLQSLAPQSNAAMEQAERRVQ